MIDRIMAIIAVCLLIAFAAVIPIKVPHLDLIALVTGIVALVLYDVWRQLALKRRG